MEEFSLPACSLIFDTCQATAGLTTHLPLSWQPRPATNIPKLIDALWPYQTDISTLRVPETFAKVSEIIYIT